MALLAPPVATLLTNKQAPKSKISGLCLFLWEFSQARKPGSFGKRRPPSIFHRFGIHNGYLKSHNWPIFEKDSPRTDFGPVLPQQ